MGTHHLDPNPDQTLQFPISGFDLRVQHHDNNTHTLCKLKPLFVFVMLFCSASSEAPKIHVPCESNLHLCMFAPTCICAELITMPTDMYLSVCFHACALNVDTHIKKDWGHRCNEGC